MSRTGGGLISRRLTGAGTSNQIGQDIERSRRFGQTPTIQRAVVVDVIMDPNLLSDDQLTRIRRTVNNPRFADVMPVNSIIARMTSDGQGTIPRTNTILFPFFSSHLMLPISPGETVEVIYEDYIGGGQQVGYWITRTSMERTIEDVNYTHFDRRYQPFNNPANFTTEQRDSRGVEQPPPGFPNGGNTVETFTLPPSGSLQERPFERIIEQATSYFNAVDGLRGFSNNGEAIITVEPVPRWRKRPQELILQGANNTLICLGEDRKGGPLGALAENTPDAKGQAGTIDIVAGRGRYLPEENQAPSDLFEENTAPFVIENTRGNFETYKTPYLNNAGSSRLDDNPVEGDPDFIRDAARLYVTMQSNADVNFGLTEIQYTEHSLPFGENGDQIEQPDEDADQTTNKSYIVGKADHIRLIARKDEENGIEGTVLIVREGTAEEELCHLFISKDGVHIDGPKIILGRGLANVAGPGADPTPGGEPYIRWSKYRDTVDRLQDEIDQLRDKLQLQHDQTLSTLDTIARILDGAFAGAIATPYSPITSLQAVGGSTLISNQISSLRGQINNLKTQAQQTVEQGTADTDDLVANSRSTKVFSE